MKKEFSRPVDSRGLNLPATKQLFEDSAIDKEERFNRQDLDFLRNIPQDRGSAKKKPAEKPNWAKLEGILGDEIKTFAQSVPQNEKDEETWHEMPAIDLTPEVQRDLRIIENRQHLNPKRFYKSTGTGRKGGQLPTHVQIGKVISGSHEFYSGRLLKKERRSRIIEEALADNNVMHYTKSRFKKLQKERIGNRRVVDPAARKNKRGKKW